MMLKNVNITIIALDMQVIPVRNMRECCMPSVIGQYVFSCSKSVTQISAR